MLSLLLRPVALTIRLLLALVALRDIVDAVDAVDTVHFDIISLGL